MQCCVEGCEIPPLCRGYCPGHYKRWLRHDDALAGNASRDPSRRCSVAGCGNLSRAKGYCNAHYKQWRRHGDPLAQGHAGQPRRYAPGDRIGRLKVTGYDTVALRYICLCACGNETRVPANNLSGGVTRSCGCLAREVTAARARHGHARHGRVTGTYRSWQAMNARCSNPRHHKWRLYGGRGIQVCEEWSGPNGFARFLADMGERPSGMTLDRIDGDGDYRPNNCRWADAATQNRNRAPRTERRRIYAHVSRALSRCELVREPCLFCGDSATVAHHHDYTQPLAVTWLCRRHHRLAHGAPLEV